MIIVNFCQLRPRLGLFHFCYWWSFLVATGNAEIQCLYRLTAHTVLFTVGNPICVYITRQLYMVLWPSLRNASSIWVMIYNPVRFLIKLSHDIFAFSQKLSSNLCSLNLQKYILSLHDQVLHKKDIFRVSSSTEYRCVACLCDACNISIKLININNIV